MRFVLLVSFALLGGCVGVAVEPAGLDTGPFATSAAAGVLREIGVSAFEPTLGIDADGALFYAGIGGAGPAVGAVPLVMRSDDGGITWTDVSPRIGPVVMPPETNDPYLYVDPDTGRVFQFAMAPVLVCSMLSWSDDKGATWTTNPRGCGNTPPYDHQAMVAAHPRTTQTVGYPNVLVQCVNNFVLSACSRSLDGGLSWAAGAPAFVDAACGGLHGHPVAHPDGTVFLPKMSCGVPELAYSEDDGLTWTSVKVADAGHPWPDPAMAVDSAGNVYYAWTSETGELLLAVSTDVGRTWGAPIVASPTGLTTHLPAIAANGAGEVVLAYPGTADLAEGYDAPEQAQDSALWYGFLTVVTDALSATPSFETTRLGEEGDPLVRGPCGPTRCPGMIDFIDVVVGPDGRPYASFVDACSAKCAADPKGENDQEVALLATLEDAPFAPRAIET